MAVSLSKGGNLSLSRSDPSLNNLLIGLGWSAKSHSGHDFDLDASVFMLTENNRVRNDNDFIFYHQLKSTCGSVTHSGDNKTGDGDGDDEELSILLNKIPSAIHKLVIAVTIHDAELRKQNFGQVSDSYMRVVNNETLTEIARFDLSEDYSLETAMIFGEIYRYSNEWKFRAVGQGYNGGLEALARQFGVNVA